MRNQYKQVYSIPQGYVPKDVLTLYTGWYLLPGQDGTTMYHYYK